MNASSNSFGADVEKAGEATDVLLDVIFRDTVTSMATCAEAGAATSRKRAAATMLRHQPRLLSARVEPCCLRGQRQLDGCGSLRDTPHETQ